jgi:hypothetical protein
VFREDPRRVDDNPNQERRYVRRPGACTDWGFSKVVVAVRE